MDSISEAHLQSVIPSLTQKTRQMAVMLEQEGIIIHVTQGLRTWDEQEKLYQQGRTTPGKIVTNAPAGSSYHNFGLAVDLVPLESAGKPDWNAEHPIWKRLIAVGESVGLVSGSEWKTFPDWPHFQYTGRFPASPNQELRDIFKNGGLQRVWQEVDGIASDVDGEISV